jgi:site-specific DNA recombinase
MSFLSVTKTLQRHHQRGAILNVLFSFAQLEREVIGERMRDKIPASKRKGIWVRKLL